jgi:hypothetical protein
MANFYDWENFWKGWRNTKVENEEDLYFQVGKTINKKPVEKEIFDLINNHIMDVLSLGSNDTLVELCCGNGLCTYEFKDWVQQIVAIDFAPHLIEAANKFKSAPNITYKLGDVFTFLNTFNDHWDVHPSKFLMNDSLAYFTPENLADMLKSIIRISGGKFAFLIRGVPNDELKWNFYNTEERKQRYLDNKAKGDETNDGLGRWWSPTELRELCRSLNINCMISNQVPPISDYRMDILIGSN